VASVAGTADKGEFPPPDHVDDGVKAVWLEIVAAHPRPETIVGPELETYCAQIAIIRDCRAQVAREGVLVEDRNGKPVPHPMLAVERETLKALKGWGDRFVPPAKPLVPHRQNGYVLKATRESVAAAKHLQGHLEFSGAIAAVETLAWLIDEAQREGPEALQKAAFGTIPTYIKGCAELQITPASVPAVAKVSDDESSPAQPTGLQAWRARKQGGDQAV
jgi:hypothetical protein